MNNPDENNPYENRDSSIIDAETVPFSPSEITRKRIRNAFIAGVVSTSITTIMTLISLSGASPLGFSAWNFLDVGLVAGLTFGIFKKSRVCAIVMFIYFLYSKIAVFTSSLETSTARVTGVSAVIFALLFLYLFFMGIIGTINYHKEKIQA